MVEPHLLSSSLMMHEMPMMLSTVVTDMNSPVADFVLSDHEDVVDQVIVTEAVVTEVVVTVHVTEVNSLDDIVNTV